MNEKRKEYLQTPSWTVQSASNKIKRMWGAAKNEHNRFVEAQALILLLNQQFNTKLAAKKLILEKKW